MAKTKAIKNQEEELVKDAGDLSQEDPENLAEELVKDAGYLSAELGWASGAYSSYFDSIEMPVYELAEKIGGDVPSLAKNLLFRLSSFLRDHPDPEYPREFEYLFKLMVKMEKDLKAYLANLLLEC